MAAILSWLLPCEAVVNEPIPKLEKFKAPTYQQVGNSTQNPNPVISWETATVTWQIEEIPGHYRKAYDAAREPEPPTIPVHFDDFRTSVSKSYVRGSTTSVSYLGGPYFFYTDPRTQLSTKSTAPPPSLIHRLEVIPKEDDPDDDWPPFDDHTDDPSEPDVDPDDNKRPDQGEAHIRKEIPDPESMVEDPDRGLVPTRGTAVWAIAKAAPNDFETKHVEIAIGHRIVTIDSPKKRDLEGKLKIEVVNGKKEQYQVYMADSETGLYTEIQFPYSMDITEPGHVGGGVHDWHAGMEYMTVVFIGSETEADSSLELKFTVDPNQGGPFKTANLILLPVELISDLNNDGEITSADSPLRDAALASGASDEDKDKGTEFLFYNDQLSNGLWDKEDSDPDKPEGEKDDDDAQEIKIVPGIQEGEVWLEHPAIAGLSFYKTRECKAGDKVNLSPVSKFSVSSQNPFPDKLFVRADGQLNFPEANQQIEGDLVLKIKMGGANGQEIEALKMKLTVVKEFGAKKFFASVEDYIWENNTKFYVSQKKYLTDVFRLVFMLEDRTLMFPIDAARRPNGGSLKGIGAVNAAYPSTVTINGNQCFFIDGRSKFLATARGDITDRCHGRVVRGGVLDQLVSSDAHLEAHSNGGRHWSAGRDYSPLAGPEPMPDGSRGGNYFSMLAAGNYEMEAGVLPSSSTNNNINPSAGMGGVSANAQRRQAAGAAIQAIGHYRKGATPEGGIIFSASTEQGSGRAADLSADAVKSGVKPLPGGRQGEIKLLFLDGSSSVALSYDKKGVGTKTVIKGGKHTNPPTYYINTYLIFQTWQPRANQ